MRIVIPHLNIALVFFGLVGIYYASFFSIHSIKNLRYGIVGIDLLVTLAAFGSLFIGEP